MKEKCIIKCLVTGNYISNESSESLVVLTDNIRQSLVLDEFEVNDYLKDKGSFSPQFFQPLKVWTNK